MRGLAPGDLVANDYQVIGELGGGAFGTVYRVRNLMDDREYAFKLFHSKGSREGAQREVLALQTLAHPNIVRYAWSGSTTEGDFYLVTELVEGPPLDQHPSWGTALSLQQVRAWGSQILSALIAIHPEQGRIDELSSKDELTTDEYDELRQLQDQGLIHRDLKAANVIVRPNEDLVLIDFGIASRADAAVGTISHSADYQPPDADLTRWTVDVDLFAAGVLIFELTCGVHPYPERQPRHVDGPFDPARLRPDLPPKVAEFLARSIAPRRPDRFGTATNMYQAFRAVMDEGAAAVDAHALSGGDGSDAGTEITDDLEPYQDYVDWPREWLPSAGSAQEVVIDGMRRIVAVEGPIVCQRLYELYVEVSDDPGVPSVKSHLNRAVAAAVRNGELSQVEPPGGGQADKTVYIPGTSPVRMRARGPRPIGHIPPSEIDATAEWFLDEGILDPESDGWPECLVGYVADSYELVEPWAVSVVRARILALIGSDDFTSNRHPPSADRR